MDRQHYNRLKAASKQEQSGACIGFAEREQARPSVRVVLAEKENTGTWLSEQMGRNIGTVSRWMTNKVQPSVEPLELCSLATNGTQELYEIAKYLDVDVRELLVSTK